MTKLNTNTPVSHSDPRVATAKLVWLLPELDVDHVYTLHKTIPESEILASVEGGSVPEGVTVIKRQLDGWTPEQLEHAVEGCLKGIPTFGAMPVHLKTSLLDRDAVVVSGWYLTYSNVGFSIFPYMEQLDRGTPPPLHDRPPLTTNAGAVVLFDPYPKEMGFDWSEMNVRGMYPPLTAGKYQVRRNKQGTLRDKLVVCRGVDIRPASGLLTGTRRKKFEVGTVLCCVVNQVDVYYEVVSKEGLLVC